MKGCVVHRTVSKVRGPKNGKTMQVVIVARISTDHQDLRSLEDQGALCRARIESEYGTSIRYEIIKSRGSGEHLDRKELSHLETLIESGQYDVVIAEDLGRICRRTRVIEFCEQCVDYNTRLIAINDRVDTDDDGWQDIATMASWHHERSNRDTSDRIKRSCNNRFDHGQLMESIIYGYIVPPGAKNDSELSRDPEAEPIIREMFQKLELGANYSEIADWLNSKNIPPGPYCRINKWNCGAVSRFVHNRLLKGERIRNRLITKRINQTGRHVSVKASPELLRTRKCPHLAYFDADYFDHVVALLDARNAKYRRGKPGKPDTRNGVPRSRTQFPGQHLRCGICGRLMHWTKCEGRKALVCSGSQQYRCWNSLVLIQELCVRKLSECVLQEVRAIPNFDGLLSEAVSAAVLAEPDDRQRRKSEFERQLRAAEKSLANILAAIESGVSHELFRGRAEELGTQIKDLRYEIGLIDRTPAIVQSIPTQDEVVALLEANFAKVLTEDQDAVRLLRVLIPSMHVLPYRCCDERGVEGRIHLTINLAPLLGTASHLPDLDPVISKQLIVDIFDLPQKVKYLADSVAQRALGKTEREIATELGITQPAVQHAFKLQRRMLELGISDPYYLLHDVPTSGKCKFQRHRNPRYRFDPLEGFPKY